MRSRPSSRAERLWYRSRTASRKTTCCEASSATRRSWAASATFLRSLAEPGVVAHTGKMQRLVFGEYDGRRSARAESFLEACRLAEIDAELSDDIRRAIWEKFVFLVGLSGATATMRAPIGPIRSNPRSRAFLLDAMREVVAVGRTQGVTLAEDYAENRLAFCDGLPEEMVSSMHGDLMRGLRLESPWLSGAVVKLGAETSVPTPVNRAIDDILALYVDGRSEKS